MDHLREPGGTTHPVGQKKPNAFGLYDMLGNASEWCEDVADSGFYSKPEACGPDPLSASGSGLRVDRGGSYSSSYGGCLSKSRSGYGPSLEGGDLGFRPAYFPLP